MNNNHEIDIKQIFKLILSKRKIFFKVSSIILIALISYVIIKEPLFSSYFSVYPISQDSSVGSNMKNLKGIASSIGLDIGSQVSASYYIPDIIESRKLRKDVVLRKWSVNNFSDNIDLIEFWGINETKMLSISNILQSFLPSKDNKNIFSKQLQTAINKIEDRIHIDELESGLFKVYVLMEDPDLSSDIANYISKYIEGYIANNLDVQSTKYRIFLENRMKNAKLDLNKIEEELTKFRKNNPIALDTPDLQLKRMRLIRDVEIDQEIYLTIMTQYELAKMNELKEKPVINILDEAFPAIDKTSPNVVQLFFFSIVFSILLSIFLILINNYSSISNNNSES